MDEKKADADAMDAMDSTIESEDGKADKLLGEAELRSEEFQDKVDKIEDRTRLTRDQAFAYLAFTLYCCERYLHAERFIRIPNPLESTPLRSSVSPAIEAAAMAAAESARNALRSEISDKKAQEIKWVEKRLLDIYHDFVDKRVPFETHDKALQKLRPEMESTILLFLNRTRGQQPDEKPFIRISPSTSDRNSFQVYTLGAYKHQAFDVHVQNETLTALHKIFG